MIWRKAWLECRFRVWLGIFLTALMLVSGLGVLPSSPMVKSPATVWDLYCGVLTFTVGIMVVNFAGSGINSQSIWGIFHGFHPSMYYMLSLPVSRRRALLVRSAVGWLLTLATIVAGALPFFFLAPLQGVPVKAGAVADAVVFLAIGSLPLFGFVTLMTTIFDEVWAGVIGYLALGAFFGAALGEFALKSPFNPLLFVDGKLMNQTHDAHWLAIAFCLAAGAALMAASVRVVERKEY